MEGAPFEMKDLKRDPSAVEIGSDVSDQHRSVIDRDNETLARLGKKQVLKVRGIQFLK